MKDQVYVKVVGHTLWKPDPKDDPKLELVKARLEVQANCKALVKSSPAVLIIDRERAVSDFALGRQLRITIEDVQQEMEFAGKPEKGAKPEKVTPLRGHRHRPAPPDAGELHPS